MSEVKEKKKFYLQNWFMYLCLIVFAPLGIFILWKFHPEMKKSQRIILTVVFVIVFVIIYSGLLGGGAEKVKVQVADFSTMTNAESDSWCDENKMDCRISTEYSDTVATGQLISQSIEKDKTVYQGDKIELVYSLGKEVSTEYKNALTKAGQYSEIMHMSKQGIYDQLVSDYGEQFPADAAQYAIDNLQADWNANALAKGKEYASTMHMSKQGVYDQLVSSYGEKFTAEEAQYAIDNLQVDWNANALAKAKDYRTTMSMSKDAVYDQLVSSYGEKFTADEAQYAIDHLDD